MKRESPVKREMDEDNTDDDDEESEDEWEDVEGNNCLLFILRSKYSYTQIYFCSLIFESFLIWIHVNVYILYTRSMLHVDICIFKRSYLIMLLEWFQSRKKTRQL